MLKLENIETAVDRLENCIAALGMTMLPDAIHVAALREALPEIVAELRAALA